MFTLVSFCVNFRYWETDETATQFWLVHLFIYLSFYCHAHTCTSRCRCRKSKHLFFIVGSIPSHVHLGTTRTTHTWSERGVDPGQERRHLRLRRALLDTRTHRRLHRQGADGARPWVIGRGGSDRK
jgi:hypothetical protein